ncbi:glycosyltransferase [bacterium]|nr:glycosyltransferase [bacterium]
MKPEVSIIIPTFNRTDFVLDSVLSAAKQTFANCEILVIDDGSDPEARSKIEEILQHPEIKSKARLIKQSHSGVCKARNTGIQEAAGNYIQFLDSDDLLHPRKIEIQKAVLDSDSALDMCYSLDEFFTENIGDVNLLWNIHSAEFHLDRFLWDDAVWSTGSPLWRRSSLEQIGGWPEELSFGFFDDWELHIRAICEGMRYVYVPLVLYYVRDHGLPRISSHESKLVLEKSKSHAVRLVWDCLQKHKMNSAIRNDALSGMMLNSADILMKEGFVSEAQDIFKQAYEYAGSLFMRFLSSAMSKLASSKFLYNLFSYPFWRLMRRRLYQNRGYWKSQKPNERNIASETNIQNFLKNVTEGKESLAPKISVIISAHNGAQRLRTTLPSHLNQTLPRQLYEVILVDNASSDDTREFVTQLNGQHNSPIRYVYEERLGLHNARHAGARAAKGDILFFTDDDASIDKDLLSQYVEAFEHHPAMSAAGGVAKPRWEKSPEPWLTELVQNGKFFPALALLDPYPNFQLSPDGYFFGVNVAIKRELLFRLGGFNPESFGNRFLGDGDTGLLRKLWLNGLHIGFIPTAKVHHHIPAHRMTISYLKHWAHNWGAEDAYSKYSQAMPSTARLCFDLLSLLVTRVPKIFFVWMLHSGKHDPRSVHRIMSASYSLEQIRYIWRLIFSKKFRGFVTYQDWLNNPPAE